MRRRRSKEREEESKFSHDLAFEEVQVPCRQASASLGFYSSLTARARSRSLLFLTGARRVSREFLPGYLCSCAHKLERGHNECARKAGSDN